MHPRFLRTRRLATEFKGKIGTAMATLTYLTTTHFDFGALQKLPSELEKAGISKLFIATDAGVRAAGLVDKVTGALAADVPISSGPAPPGATPYCGQGQPEKNTGRFILRRRSRLLVPFMPTHGMMP